MRISVSVVAFLVACSKKEPDPPLALEQLMTDDVTSVMLTDVEDFPLAAISKEIIETQPCWDEQLKSTKAAYQVLLVGDSYFIAETPVTREDFEKCFTTVFKPGAKFKDDDGMLSIDTPLGVGHAAWRNGYVIFGARRHVVAALAPHSEATAAKWKKLMPKGPAPMAMASTDPSLAILMGAEVTDWSLTLDKLQKTPAPFIGGTFTAHYATSDAALKALEYIRGWSTSGKFPKQVSDDPDITAAFDGFAAAIGKLHPTVTGNEIKVAYDSDQLGGPLFFAGVLSHFDKLQGKVPLK